MPRFRSFIWLLVLAGSLAPLASLVDLAVAQSWTATWAQKHMVGDPPTGPGARGSASMIFDDMVGQAVLFGGLDQVPLNDLFLYDGATDRWVSEAPGVPCDAAGDFAPPTPRDGHALVYDGFNRLYWSIGGSNDVCRGAARTAAAGTTRTLVVDGAVPTGPADFYKDWTVELVRGGAKAYVASYDPAAARLTLVAPLAGLAAGSPYYLYPQRAGGTWYYEPATGTWASLDGPHWGYIGQSPSSRVGPAAAYSPAARAVVLFGGDPALNDTWVLDVQTKTWARAIAPGVAGSPPAVLGVSGAMVYDPNHDLFILFGGRCGTCATGDSSADIWIYRLSTNAWTKISPVTSPPTRQRHTLVYDLDHHVALLFGGHDGSSYLNDLWAYDPQAQTWTSVATFTGPTVRAGHALVYDPVHRVSVLYGGADPAALADVWTLSLAAAPAATHLAASTAGRNTAPFGWLDSPGAGATVSGTSLTVSGWALDSEDPTLTVELLIDGAVVSSMPTHYARPDVCDAYPSVSHCSSSQPGVLFNWNTTTVSNGPHTIALRATDPGGLSATLGSRTISVSNGGGANTAPFGWLDAPVSGATVSGAGVTAIGWGLDQEDATLTVQLLVDGGVVSSTPTRSARPDVCNAYPAVSQCASSQPGATFSWDSTTVSNGSHTIALRLTDSGGLSTTVGSRTVTVNNAGSPSFSDVLLASGLSNPTAMALAPDGRMFVTEQGGTLRVIKNGVLLSTPFLTVITDSAGERGLLGVAFDPSFATNHFVYVYYTATTPNTHNRVSRFTANGDVAVAGSETVLIDLNPLSSATNHNGGAIHFGQDGKLYIGVGENANGANSQTLANLLGKLLRIDADGSIPTDNPFLGTASGVNRAIWAIGLRNPFTFSVQPGTGRIFINDVGQDTWEEINDGIAGSNYGWPASEGPTSNPNFRGPLFAYGHGSTSTTGCAITGGAFYNPVTVQFPADFVGKYFFADLCRGWIRRFDPATGTAVDFRSGYQAPVDLLVGPDGTLYVLTRGDGAVHMIRFGS